MRSRSNGVVNGRKNIVTVRERRAAFVERYRPLTEQAAKRAPVKVLAQETGLSPRDIQTMRTGPVNYVPQAPTLIALAKHDEPLRDAMLNDLTGGVWLAMKQARPDLARAIDAALSGDVEVASPEAIQNLVRFFQGL